MSFSSPKIRERLEWIRYYERCGNVCQICRFFGISRPVFYKWLRRYREQGIAGLSDVSRRPKRFRQPGIPVEWIVKAVELKEKHPTISKYRLSEMLEVWYGMRISPSGVWRILRQHARNNRTTQNELPQFPLERSMRTPLSGVRKVFQVRKIRDRLATAFLTTKRRARITLRKQVVKERTTGALVFARAGLAFALVASPVVTFPQQEETATVAGVTLSVDRPNPLALASAPTVSPQIVESEYERNIREEAERQREEQVKRAIAARPTTAPKRSGCPTSFRPLYGQAGEAFGVPWEVLEAVHQVESGKSCHTDRTSEKGATGPMQFLPGTFSRYATDGDGDGVADISNAYDAIYSAARHLGTGLHGGSLYQALFNYNPAGWYVEKVLGIARELGWDVVE